ncbi:hypothetical protein A2X44_02455 [candidate division CPR3 bacterium GWF2_35_18]|uniref:RNA polymerase, sigma-24 subunit, ECF subfamily n=1 Tax=candidate division CPR3 bacterium GW2011_GWF2_35_18 TaxID=1618350 RepID=A0A0G0BKS4_UNCC3|nr:MAG: RNA polymerase, sigma-24 subunit, ECF subfamily [candidate division CPR3 bacterium GW2011_GWF2_35_18]KKP85045.1 MAG: RNA polymerase, sigma-24 subunit, ECF subfamily [candidate division CPR3 bacterium GW2011_GWE2_35_7]OGB62856.1 MAG: hypothetical protein A2X44_02455 [candidate division CPR3 bacterium GWF2_35_18]OGB65437.1 MAG: hypothetical protein A2250_00670 [candidate division CPR3 bacterium RIFOXYA2_FULL_35_13]OGB78955.1 MAG: hypothetical protein A2296_03315 [candidate division CPR3 b
MLPPSEIEAIYNNHSEKLYRFFYFKIRDQQEAEDLTSDTFHLLIKKLKQVEIENPINFLYGIAKNLFKVYLREKYQIKTCPFLEEFHDFQKYTEEYLEKENSQTSEELLLKYLPQLPEKQKEIIELRLIQKLTPTEIGEKINKDLNYVRTTQKRAVKNLRRIITCTP